MPDSIGAFAATLSGGFFAGILIGYALKKVVKLIAVVVGLFLAGLAYLQYQQIVVISWNKIRTLTILEARVTAFTGIVIRSIESGDKFDKTWRVIYRKLVYPCK